MKDHSYIHVGQYYVGITVYEIVDTYRGEDSKAIYPVWGNYQTALHCDLKPILDEKLPSGGTVKGFLDDVVARWPREAGSHYSPVGVSFLDYAKQQPGVIVSNYEKNYGIVGFLPEEYKKITYLYNGFYSVMHYNNKCAVYKAGNKLEDQDFIYQKIEDLGDYKIAVTKNGKTGIISLRNHEYDILQDYILDSIANIKISDKTFIRLWPNLKLSDSFTASLDGKQGIYNTNEGWIISNTYDSIKFLEDKSFIAASNNSKFGLINTEETVVSPFSYESIENLNFNVEGLWEQCNNDNTFIFTEKGFRGIFNTQKGILLKAKYEGLDLFENKTLKVCTNKMYGVVSLTGEVIVPCEYDDIENDGDYYILLKVVKGNDYHWEKTYFRGVIKNNGNLIIPCDYNLIDRYGDIFVVKIEGRCGCIDSNGNFLIECKYSYLKLIDNIFIAGIYSDVYGHNVYGIIDINGNSIIDCFYNSIKHLDDKIFRLEVLGKSIEVTIGKKFSYSDTKPLCKNLFKKKLIAWGIFNSEGEQISPCIYNDIKYEPQYDIFRISTSTERNANSKKWGLLSLKGEELCPPIFGSISTFKDGVAKVSGYYGSYNGSGLLSKDGNLIPQDEIKLDSHYSAIKSMGLWALKNNNAIITRYMYYSISCIKEGYYVVELANSETIYMGRKCHSSKFGLMDKDLNIVVPIEYASIKIFSDDLLLVTNYDRNRNKCCYGCIGFNGQEVCNTKYDKISLLPNGHVMTENYKDCRIFSQQGECIIGYGYSRIVWVEELNMYIGYLKDTYNSGLYDAKGKELLHITNGTISFLHNDRLLIRQKGLLGVCDIYGKIIIPCEYQSIEFSDNRYLAKRKLHKTSQMDIISLDGVLKLDVD